MDSDRFLLEKRGGGDAKRLTSLTLSDGSPFFIPWHTRPTHKHQHTPFSLRMTSSGCDILVCPPLHRLNSATLPRSHGPSYRYPPPRGHRRGSLIGGSYDGNRDLGNKALYWEASSPAGAALSETPRPTILISPTKILHIADIFPHTY